MKLWLLLLFFKTNVVTVDNISSLEECVRVAENIRNPNLTEYQCIDIVKNKPIKTYPFKYTLPG